MLVVAVHSVSCVSVRLLFFVVVFLFLVIADMTQSAKQKRQNHKKRKLEEANQKRRKVCRRKKNESDEVRERINAQE